MDTLLAQLKAERKKERKAKAPSSRRRTADEVWEETTARARKPNALRRRIEAGEAHPAEEVIAIAAMPDSLAGLSPKLERSRAEAREKVLELLAANTLPIAQAVEEVRKKREAAPPKPTKGKWTPEAHRGSWGDEEGVYLPDTPRAEGEMVFGLNPIEATSLFYRSFKEAEKLAEELTKRGEISDTEEQKEHAFNFIRHFLGGYRAAKLYGPMRAWQLGIAYEDIGSRFLDWLKKKSPEEAQEDRETDLANNLRGINAALEPKNRARTDDDIAVEEYLKLRKAVQTLKRR